MADEGDTVEVEGQRLVIPTSLRNTLNTEAVQDGQGNLFMRKDGVIHIKTSAGKVYAIQ